MNKLLTALFCVTFVALSSLFLSPQIQAQTTDQKPQTELLEGLITKIDSQKQKDIIDTSNEAPSTESENPLELIVTQYTVELATNPPETVTIQNEQLSTDTNALYKTGDRVVIGKEMGPDNTPVYYISDHIRRPALLWLFAIFVFLVLAISGWHGIRSLIGLGASFFIMFTFLLPFIERGYDPVTIAIISSLFIIACTFYLSHGFSIKTTQAVAGTFVSLIMTGILSIIFINLAKLSGFAAEETAFLQIIKGSDFNASGLLLAGIIIGTLGVLDDITISQASVVAEIRQANPKLSQNDLFFKAMNVGKDHIASLVNTLILVYTGSAMPLLLLFLNSNFPLSTILNFEIIAEEIVRTLVGSIGLVMAVPITTILAVWWEHLPVQFQLLSESHPHDSRSKSAE